jgi:hypothetical protein
MCKYVLESGNQISASVTHFLFGKSRDSKNHGSSLNADDEMEDEEEEGLEIDYEL